MLRSAIELEVNPECRNPFEVRIGKQLDEATIRDLSIPSQGYAKEEQYDTECVRRILKSFYCNYTGPDASGLIAVAELVEDFLAQVASDIDLKTSTFTSLADMSIAASEGTRRSSDGIYRAIDIYLDRHRYLTRSEREEACRLLDCNKMSPDACEHAAQNEWLPLRLVVQVLFVGQLKLRDTIAKEVSYDDRLKQLGDEEEGGEPARNSSSKEVLTEIEKMGSKALELERECCSMREEIQGDSCSGVKREKISMWKEMKRKFGCISSMHDCNCHVKKKKLHPR
ncbi:unnamed protein product [Ilex paraguariensis]|uniref:NPH3 domain-containing protein n=1 Tax=Ilex paraguariensis TaxID=185542 RepID=A0ABC8R7Y9_9AQUA